MRKFIFLIFIVVFTASCEISKEPEIIDKPKNEIDESTHSCIDSLTKIESYIDNGYGFTCDSDMTNCFNTIRDSIAKEDLLSIYYREDINYPFKLYLFKTIYSKHKDLRVQLLDEAVNVTTIIEHSSSCFGIGYESTYEKDCFVYAYKNDRDSIGSVIIQNHQHLSFLPNILSTIKPLKENYQTIRNLSDSIPEAVLALSKYKYLEDTLIIKEKLDKYLSKSDTSSLLKCLSILDYSISIPGESNYRPYKPYYESLILDFNLHSSNNYRTAIPKIIYCYIKNLDSPYPKLDIIIDNLIAEYSNADNLEMDKRNSIYALESIYASFYEALYLKHYKMHEQELIKLEKFLKKEKGNLTNYPFGYFYIDLF